MFPQTDPIPLPAPVWLFKLLELLTVTLHFTAVQLMVGGLVVATAWALRGRLKADRTAIDASGAIARRLPIVMIYVINLGVPPLLFAQVLYGRALYTSSVLIGAYWIGVIFLLAVAYSLLYVMAGRAAGGKAWGWIGVVAFLIVAKIALIYSSNMTLMIRPEVWAEMYRADPHGLHLNTGDPTVLPRWLFMLLGGLTTGGVGLMLLGMKRALQTETAQLLRIWGPRFAVAGVAAQAAAGYWVLAAQPAGVWSAMAESPIYLGVLVVWIASAGALVAVCVPAQARAALPGWKLPLACGGLVFLEVVATAVFRGGIRDTTLLAAGFDVWDRQVASNWVVVGLFVVLFVIGLSLVVWLATVAARAQAVEEKYV